MLRWRKGRGADAGKAAELYGAVVAQARAVPFYAEMGVPDTPVGRYEMIVVHLFLVLERLRLAGDPAQELSRLLIETFVTDVDDQLREMGVGDLSVPKKVKRAAAVLYARTAVYRAALASEERDALARALRAALAEAGAREVAAERLARYVRTAAEALAAQPASAIEQASVRFPDPAAMPSAAVTS
jgi:cytochrome b pre-mRNA-processing protein 3